MTKTHKTRKNFSNALGALTITITFYPAFIAIAYITKDDLIISHFIFIFLFLLASKYVIKSLFHNDKNNSYKEIQRTTNPLILAASWCISIPLMALIIAFPSYNSIPNLLHQITKKPGEIVVTVKSKQYEDGGIKKSLRRCYGYTLIINEFIPPFNQFCVYKNTYDSITPGDSLRLVGEKSRFGFSFKELYLD